MKGPHKSMADLARQKNTHPVELMIDMALERDMKFFMIQPIANENQAEALELMKHPRSVVTFSDSGAHVSQIMDSSLQTHLLVAEGPQIVSPVDPDGQIAPPSGQVQMPPCLVHLPLAHSLPVPAGSQGSPFGSPHRLLPHTVLFGQLGLQSPLTH